MQVDDGAAGPMDEAILGVQRKHLEVLKKLFNTAYFIIKKEDSFTSFPSLLQLQKKNGSDLRQLDSYCSDQACRRFVPFIAEAIREEINNDISGASVLTVLYDGATDCSISEVEIIYIRIAKNGHVRECFAGLEDLEHAHAQGVYEALDRAMTGCGIPDWKEKLVGAGSDGAKVNIGRNNSVATRLSENRPYVIIGHCVAHRLELGVLEAIREHPMLGNVQDMLKKVHKHYHYSPKALRELRAIAEAMEEKVIKPTRLQGTRWVPHIYKAMNTLLKDYTVILAHFEHVAEAAPGQATAEVKGRARYMTTKLRDWRILRFMSFLQDVLEVISRLSLRFQIQSATCMDFLDALETANLELATLRIQPGQHLEEFNNSLQVNDGHCIFKNASLTNFDPQRGYEDLQGIIDTVTQRINGRLENAADPTRLVFQATRIFHLNVWPDNREDLAQFGNNELQVLCDHFATVLDRLGCDRRALQREWVQVKAHLGNRLLQVHPRPRAEQLPSFTSLYLTQAHRDRFSNFLKLVDIVFTLPVSSSTCERGFSAVKRIKSDWRSALTTDMMNKLLTVAIEGPSVEEYHAERAIHLWMTRGQRRRRPNFIPDPGQDDAEEDNLFDYLQRMGAA